MIDTNKFVTCRTFWSTYVHVEVPYNKNSMQYYINLAGWVGNDITVLLLI
jgi:hypothetical protein